MSETNKVPEIKKQVVFDAPIEKVWKAVATSDGIAEWFMPNDFEPIEGHQFYIKSQFETSLCKVIKINPPKELTFSWGEFGWEVSFLLEAIEERTSFTLIHSGWGEPDETIPGQSRTYLTTRNIMNNGWDKLVDNGLRKVVEEE
ncbi:SRPBCC domain-containing protein [Virgibacillus necropolis]|uniref:SRPBCC family protein n=1 Tax=Virgibacillus necropolis TaxID=163877 RepID=UPI00384DBB14